MFSPPMQSQDLDTMYELANAAVEEGHEVTVFFDLEATYSLMAIQSSANKNTPIRKLTQLIQKGIQLLVCRESARLRGIDVKHNLIKGVIESSLGKLAELMEEYDRIITFAT